MKQKYLVCLFKTKISRGNISFKKKKRKVRIGAQDLVGMISRRKLRKLCVFFENNLIEKRMRHLIYDIKFYQISHPKEKVSTCLFFFFFSTFGPFTFFLLSNIVVPQTCDLTTEPFLSVTHCSWDVINNARAFL